MEIHHKVPDCEQATCVPEVVRWWEKYEVTKNWFDFKIFEWINTQIGGRPCGEKSFEEKSGCRGFRGWQSTENESKLCLISIYVVNKFIWYRHLKIICFRYR